MIREMAEAERIIKGWRCDYSKNRPHSSLNYQTQEEFARCRPFVNRKIKVP
jgi:putative transposase